MPSTVTFSYAGIGEMLRSEWMEADMRERAQRMMDFAVSIAPVYAGKGGDSHRGRYKASFHVTSTRHGGFRHDRAAGVLTNDAPEAVFAEFGTSRQAAHHVLRRSLHAAG